MDKIQHDKRMIEQSKKIQEAYEKKLLSGRGKKLTPRQINVLETIEANPDVTNKELMIILGITRSTLKEHIESLTIRDLVKFRTGIRGLKNYRVNKPVMRKIMLIN